MEVHKSVSFLGHLGLYCQSLQKLEFKSEGFYRNCTEANVFFPQTLKTLDKHSGVGESTLACLQFPGSRPDLANIHMCIRKQTQLRSISFGKCAALRITTRYSAWPVCSEAVVTTLNVGSRNHCEQQRCSGNCGLYKTSQPRVSSKERAWLTLWDSQKLFPCKAGGTWHLLINEKLFLHFSY